ncbi:hypothetical protein GE09DRAFT_1218518 [Coniochaeta sp. 2T2.1]|nr:hypothetical protein GE09DRAFT_1218518 [Coniochaeta sp. 2T2.1]
MAGTRKRQDWCPQTHEAILIALVDHVKPAPRSPKLEIRFGAEDVDIDWEARPRSANPPRLWRGIQYKLMCLAGPKVNLPGLQLHKVMFMNLVDRLDDVDPERPYRFFLQIIIIRPGSTARR